MVPNKLGPTRLDCSSCSMLRLTAGPTRCANNAEDIKKTSSVEIVQMPSDTLKHQRKRGNRLTHKPQGFWLASNFHGVSHARLKHLPRDRLGPSKSNELFDTGRRYDAHWVLLAQFGRTEEAKRKTQGRCQPEVGPELWQP